MEFPIALLTIAAFLFLTGVVGHDTEASGAKFAFKVTGKVGPLPRVVLTIASGVTLTLALALYAVELSEAQPTPPQPIQVVEPTPDTDLH